MCLQHNGLAISQQSFGTPLAGKKTWISKLRPVTISKKLSTPHCLSQKSKRCKRRNNSCIMPGKHVILFSLEGGLLISPTCHSLFLWKDFKMLITTCCKHSTLYTFKATDLTDTESVLAVPALDRCECEAGYHGNTSNLSQTCQKKCFRKVPWHFLLQRESSSVLTQLHFTPQ